MIKNGKVVLTSDYLGDFPKLGAIPVTVLITLKTKNFFSLLYWIIVKGKYNYKNFEDGFD